MAIPRVNLAVSLELEVTIMQLTRYIDEELRYWLLGQAIRRIRRFCEKYDSDGDGVVMSREIERDFLKDRDHEYLILIAVKDMKVVGHLLAAMERYYGRLAVCVRQLEIDPEAKIPLQRQRDAFKLVEDWKRENRATKIRALVLNPMLVPWFKQFGFVRTHSVMEQKE